jgi:hypothetical protein
MYVLGEAGIAPYNCMMSKGQEIQYEHDIWDFANHAVSSFEEESQVEISERERLVDFVAEAIRAALEGAIRVPDEE